MNERFDQLWAQALDAAVPETYSRLSYSQVLKIKQVFAELIVRECADVIQKEVSMKYKDGSGETEEFMAGHYGGSLLARVMIAQHFGFKE